ncbi:MAG: hypothetical protein WCS67_01615 [Bacteroidales bacterium]
MRKLYFRLLVIIFCLRQKISRPLKVVKERRRILDKLVRFRDLSTVGFNVSYYDPKEVVFIALHYGYGFKCETNNGRTYFILKRRTIKEDDYD